MPDCPLYKGTSAAEGLKTKEVAYKLYIFSCIPDIKTDNLSASYSRKKSHFAWLYQYCNSLWYAH